MSLNQVNLIGRVTKDLELRFTSNNKAMVKFTLAVNETKEKTNFIDIVVFGNSAEYLCKYLKSKGRLCVTGVLQNNNYESNGVKYYSYNVLAREVSIIDFKEKQTDEVINPFLDEPAEKYIF